MNMADRIQHLRKTKGLSQEELADQVGVSRQAVSKWESGQSTPDLDKVVIMSDLFQVTTDYILKGTEPASSASNGAIKMKWLYLGFAIAFAAAAGIWAFTANRFNNSECFCIILAGAAAGLGVSLVIHGISGLLQNR